MPGILRVPAVTVGVVLLLAAQGCGSKKKTETTTAPTQSSLAWAGGVCSAFTTWKTDVTAAGQAVKSNPTKAGVQKAIDDAQAATKKLADSVTALKAPQTNSVESAKKTIQTLEGQLKNDVSVIKRTIENPSSTGGITQAMTSVQATVATMRQQVKAAADSLQSLTRGELKDAFDQAPACQSLTGGSG